MIVELICAADGHQVKLTGYGHAEPHLYDRAAIPTCTEWTNGMSVCRQGLEKESPPSETGFLARPLLATFAGNVCASL